MKASLALKPLLDLKAEMHHLEERLGDASLTLEEHEAVLHRYSDVQDRFRISDGYQIELKVATILRGLGFEPAMDQQLTDHLSGGWQMRIALAELLLSQPDLLLLDEPTNHLDLEARNWLEEYLRSYPHAVIVVSHDRYFLDAIVTRHRRAVDCARHRLPRQLLDATSSSETNGWRGCGRRRSGSTRRSSASRQFINRFRYQASKAAQVQSRIKLLGKDRAHRGAARASPHSLSFPALGRAAAATVLDLKDVEKGVRRKVVSTM